MFIVLSTQTPCSCSESLDELRERNLSDGSRVMCGDCGKLWRLQNGAWSLDIFRSYSVGGIW